MTYKLRTTLSVLFGIVVLMLAGTVAFAAGLLLGDFDQDGKVTVMDATYVQRDLAGLSVGSEFSRSAADIDGNGEIEVVDATYIQRYTAQMGTPYPIGEQPTEVSTQPTAPPTPRPTDSEGWGRDIYKP